MVPLSSNAMLNLISFPRHVFGGMFKLNRNTLKWIVLILDSLQAGIDMWWIGGPEIVVPAFAGEVHIRLTFSVAFHCISGSSCPGTLWRKVCRVGCTRGAVEEEWRAAVGKCCAVGRNLEDCTAEVMEVELGLYRKVG